MRTEVSRFWQFSLALYARQGVAEACLRLQDEFGLDVNVLLYCVFRGSKGHRLDGPDIIAADENVSRWRADVVRPLRAIRRVMKDTRLLTDTAGQSALRAQIKACELESERLQQLELERFGAGFAVAVTSPRQAATANYHGYGAALGKPLPQDVLALLIETFPA